MITRDPTSDRSRLRMLALFFSISLALITGSILWLDVKNSTEEVYRNAENRGKLLMATMQSQISDALYFNNVERIRKDVDQLITQNYLSKVSIFTISGQLLYDSTQEKVPAGKIDQELSDLALVYGSSHRRLDHIIEFVGDLSLDQITIGGIYFTLDISAQLKTAESLLYQKLIFVSLMILLASGLSFTMASTLGVTQSLKTVESNFRELIDQSPVSTAIFTKDGTLTYANDAFTTIMDKNTSTRSALQSDYNILQDPHYLNSKLMPQIVQGFSSKPVEIPKFLYGQQDTPSQNSNFGTPNDNISNALWLKAVIFPLKNEEYGIKEVVVIYQDISAELQSETEKEILNAQMLQSQKLEGLGIMAGGIAHDFNNLLMPVSGNAELLGLELPADSDLHKYVDSIIRASTRAADLCSQMLVYAGTGSGNKGPIDLSAEIVGLNELFRSSLDKKTILNQFLAPKLPLIFANQTQIRQIILNLLINASDALEGETGHVSLTTGVTTLSTADIATLLPNNKLHEGNYVFLEIIDSGCGMDEQTKQNLFNPFYTTKFTGRGLGMSAALGIIGDHGGGIKVETVLGTGSTFTVYFPIAEIVPELPIDKPSAPIQNFSGHVLLVDDELQVRQVSEAMLKNLGLSVTTAADGAAAIRSFQSKTKYNFVVLDIMMPELNGEETLSELRKIDPSIPVIMVSGFSAGENIKRLSALPNIKILRKPYTLTELTTAIKTIC